MSCYYHHYTLTLGIFVEKLIFSLLRRQRGPERDPNIVVICAITSLGWHAFGHGDKSMCDESGEMAGNGIPCYDRTIEM